MTNKMYPKTCFACKHFWVRTAEPGYSEYTPSSPMSFECSKNVWKYDPYEDGQISLEKKLHTALDCSLFEQREI